MAAPELCGEDEYDDVAHSISLKHNVCYKKKSKDKNSMPKSFRAMRRSLTEETDSQFHNNGTTISNSNYSGGATDDDTYASVMPKVFSTKNSINKKKCFTALGLVSVVLVLSLVAACTAFAVEIMKVRSEVAFLTSQLSSNVRTEMAFFSNQVARLQTTVSDGLDNVSSLLQLASLQQTFNAISAELTKVTQLQMTFSDGLANISSLLELASRLQRTFNTTSDELINATFVFHQESIAISEDAKERVHQVNMTSDRLFQQLQAIAFTLNLTLEDYVTSSCASLPPASQSGYYWVRTSNGSAVRVYCDMTRSCGGITGGWMRVAHLDMTNSSQRCPKGFNQRTDSNIRSCVRNDLTVCGSITAPAIAHYRDVCGKVIAYQIGTTDAFRSSGRNVIDKPYVDGVSVTYGSPRRHIWTFASALDELETNGAYYSCSCIRGNQGPVPFFVKDDYFCDTGSHNHNAAATFYSDPLWDGAGCERESTCCSFNNPPWFYRRLPQPTSDDIEIRVCTNSGPGENIGIAIAEIYIRE